MFKVEIILTLYFFLSWTVITEVTTESERKIVKLRDRVKRDVDILADCNDQCLSKDQTTDYDVLLEYDYGDGKPCIYACKFLNVNKTEDDVRERFLPLKASKNRTSNYEIVGFSSFEKPYDENTQNIIVTFSPEIKHVVPTKATTKTSPATEKFETSNINVPLKVALVPTSQVNQSRFLQTTTNFTTASKEQNLYSTTTSTPLLSAVPMIPKVIRLSVLEAEMVKAESASYPSLKNFQVPGVSDFISKTKNISWPEIYSEKTISTLNTEMINRLNVNQELNDVFYDKNTITEQEKDLLPKIKSKITSSSTASTPIVSLTSPNARQSSFTSFTITLPTSKHGHKSPASVGSTKPFPSRFDDISKKFPDIVTSSSLLPKLTSTLKLSNQNSKKVSTAIESTVSTNLNDEAMLSSVASQTVKMSTEFGITPELPGVTASINKPVHIIPSSTMHLKPDSLVEQNIFMSTASPVLRSSSELDSVSTASSKKGLMSAQTEYGSTFSTVHANSSKLIGTRLRVSTAPNGLSDNDSTPSLSTLPENSNAQIDVGSTLSKLLTSSTLLDSGPTTSLEPAKSGELNGSEQKFVSMQTNVSKQIDLDSPLSTLPRLSEFDPFSTLSTVIVSSNVNNSEFNLSTIPVSLSKQADLVSTFSVDSTNSSDRDLVFHKRLNSSVPNYFRHTLSPTQNILSEKNSSRSILSPTNSSSELNVSFSTMPTKPTSLNELITSSMSTTEALSKVHSDLTLSAMASFTGNGLIDSGSTESTITNISRKIDFESTDSTIAASLNKLIDPASISSKTPPSSTKLSDIASTVSTGILQTNEYGYGSIKSKILASLAGLIKPSTVLSTVPSIGLNNLVPSVSSILGSLYGSSDFASSSTTLSKLSSEVNHLKVSPTQKMEMTTSAGTPEGLQNSTDLMSEHKIISESLYGKNFSTSTVKSTNMHAQNNSSYTMLVEQTTHFNLTTIQPTFNDTSVLNSTETQTNDAAIPTETKQTSSINLKKLGTFADYYEIVQPFESLEHFSGTNMSTLEETLLA